MADDRAKGRVGARSGRWPGVATPPPGAWPAGGTRLGPLLPSGVTSRGDPLPRLQPGQPAPEFALESDAGTVEALCGVRPEGHAAAVLERVGASGG